ncbi:unnamed protein product, partial [Rotaria magnacalcarata]
MGSSPSKSNVAKAPSLP